MASIKKNSKVTATGFQVDRNVIYYGDTIINTNCISMISIAPIPSNKTWILALILAYTGVRGIREAPGVLSLIVAIIWIIVVVIYNLKRGKNLAVNLNSGNTLYFHSGSDEFLMQVISLMDECMKTNSGNYYVNLDSCVINKGSGNMTVGGGIRYNGKR